MNKIIIAGSILILLGCSPTVTQDLYWIDQYGEQVPIIVTVEGQDTVYDFGTIIMYPDTTWRPDTINNIIH
jgi:hypothetical protein